MIDDRIRELIDRFAAEPDRDKQQEIFEQLRQLILDQQREKTNAAGNG